MQHYEQAVADCNKAIELYTGKCYAKALYTRGLACVGLVDTMQSQLTGPSAAAFREKSAQLLELAKEDMAAALAHSPDVANEL